MMDENIARLRTHRNNIARYRRLLQTKLTDLERQFIERRLTARTALSIVGPPLARMRSRSPRARPPVPR
jgi:hypothetical protein